MLSLIIYSFEYKNPCKGSLMSLFSVVDWFIKKRYELLVIFLWLGWVIWVSCIICLSWLDDRQDKWYLETLCRIQIHLKVGTVPFGLSVQLNEMGWLLHWWSCNLCVIGRLGSCV